MENEEVIQEVNHLLKSITGPMPKTIGKRAECGPCEAKTVKVTPKNSINPGPERAAQAVQEVNHHMKGTPKSLQCLRLTAIPNQNARHDPCPGTDLAKPLSPLETLALTSLDQTIMVLLCSIRF